MAGARSRWPEGGEVATGAAACRGSAAESGSRNVWPGFVAARSGSRAESGRSESSQAPKPAAVATVQTSSRRVDSALVGARKVVAARVAPRSYGQEEPPPNRAAVGRAQSRMQSPVAGLLAQSRSR